MTQSTDIAIGIDVGTTSIKAHAFTMDGKIVGRASLPTPWNVLVNGQTEIDIDVLADTAIHVMVESVPGSHPHGSVIGVGITGMAETGVLVDARHRPLMSAIAWFDERGKNELQELDLEFAANFSAHTGLGFKAESSFSKLLWRKRLGADIPVGSRWLNALEYIAYRLTGTSVTEPSLASRTGLFDQQTSNPWIPALEQIGADTTLIPELHLAGTSIGQVGEFAPAELRGAEVTVAGHDHLVGAVGAGVAGANDLYNSCGTADVVLRSVERVLTNDERTTLVARGLSAGRHVIPAATAILGATRSGLVLGRVLAMLGANDRQARRAIADSWDPHNESEVSVSQPQDWTNEVTISLRGDVSPTDVWASAMAYVLSDTSALVHAADDIAGPHGRATASGGWAQIDGVFRGKSQVTPGLNRFDGEEPGSRGASALAALAAHHTNVPLTANLAVAFSTPPQKELVQ